ncbi:MAG: hypothetical protein AB1405_00160 [Bdellovibrionota bacterium]
MGTADIQTRQKLESYPRDLADRAQDIKTYQGWPNKTPEEHRSDAVGQLTILASCIDALLDAVFVEGTTAPFNILVSLRNTLQKQIYPHLDQWIVGPSLDNFTNLSNGINVLHQTLWSSGLFHRNESISQFEQKLRYVGQLQSELENALKKAREAEDIRTQAQTSLAQVNESKIAAANASKEAQTLQAQAQQAVVAVTTSKDQITAQQAEIKKSSDEVGALREKIVKFHGEIDENKKKLESSIYTAEKAMEKHKAETTDLLRQLGELQEKYKAQLKIATSTGLFRAFHQRKEELYTARKRWLWFLAFAAAAAAVGTFVLVLEFGQKDAGSLFWIRLLSIGPIIFLIYFFASQYRRDRSAEEVYAFKSALSLSLEGYSTLVRDLAAKDQAVEYAKFLTETIEKIFKDSQFDRRASAESEPDILSNLPKDILEAVAKIVQVARK